MKSFIYLAILSGACLSRIQAAVPETEIGRNSSPLRLSIPDVHVIDQDGHSRRFLTDLVQGRRIVAVNFIFTGCSTICPIMATTFGQVRKTLKLESGSEVSLISISLTPDDDTPERLKAWGEKFQAGPGWTLVTGTKRNIDELLRAFQLPLGNPFAHQPQVFISDRAGQWSRLNGLVPAEKLGQILAQSRPTAATAPPSARDPGKKLVSPAQRYFPDTILVSQDGEEMRFYSDLLRGKVVVINSFFASCQGTCPLMMTALAAMQEEFADRLGKDLFFISISVDPEHDQPKVLKEYTAQLKTKPGWRLMTGRKEAVNDVLRKIGQFAEVPENHSNLFIVGNESTGLWKKAFGLSDPRGIARVIESVLNDQPNGGSPSPTISARSQSSSAN